MRRLISIVGLTAALAAVWPAAAIASNPGRVDFGAGLPLVGVSSATVPPPGFSTNARQAIAIAKATPAIQRLHRHTHPLTFTALVLLIRPPHWVVYFAYHGTLDGEVDISPRGHVLGAWTGPEAAASYSHGHYAAVFDSWWVVVPAALLFLLPFLDLRRLRRLVHLDALALLSFLVSYALFDHGHLIAGVWLAYPPLLYLLTRMLLIGLRRRTGGGGGSVSPLLPTAVLGAGLILMVLARVALSLIDPNVMDVGYASVIGAHRIVHGQSIYFASAAHGDTYGPITYLAYVPFEVLFPWHGTWGYLPSAHVASIVFDLVTIIALVCLGRRMRPGRDGLRLGLALGWVWAACPFTLLGLMMHTNDGLIAMLSVLSLLAFNSPAGRGALLGLAAAAKFSPGALLPLYARGRGRSVKGTLACVASFAVVVITAIGLYLPPGGISEFYNHTIGFQLTRSDVFSPWALHPGLSPIKLVLEAAALGLAALLAFLPKQRSLVQVAALAGAVTIAVQLPAVHWFYYYIIWFFPFVIVVLLGRPVAVEATVTVPQEAASSTTYVPGAPVRVGA